MSRPVSGSSPSTTTRRLVNVLFVRSGSIAHPINVTESFGGEMGALLEEQHAEKCVGVDRDATVDPLTRDANKVGK